MGKVLFLLLAVIASTNLYAWSVDAQAVQFELDAAVFNDLDRNGIWDTPGEPQVNAWQIELYDDLWNLIDSDTTSASIDTSFLVALQPSYICISPQAGWSQTAPLSGSIHPINNSVCHNFDNTNGIDVYEFGVIETHDQEGEVEDTGRIIVQDPSIPVEKVPPPETPQVLGATSDPQLLAETGSPAIISSITGIVILLITSLSYLRTRNEI